ncbi:MAG: ATP phosphoribosyltransferase [Candidatus Latescibacteria bacterium]|jgi:ATP phosphoribosyltransferase|nr:ATP phosphoribosyltransferase [Candidatus Latescibacterota bacterium]
MSNELKIGLPKGSLQEATFVLMRRAGFSFSVNSRSYFPECDDPEISGVLIRAQEIARYVEQGVFDAGLTGLDWVRENGADVVEIADLVYSKATRRKARWVLAVAEGSDFESVKDLEGKRIATEAVNLTDEYFRSHGVSANVEFSWGATEVKVPDLVDAIVEITETGSSLRANKLRIIDTVLETNTKLIANKDAWADPWKKQKIENLSMLLRAALDAEGLVGLKANVPNGSLGDVVAILPEEKRPTVSPLRDHDGNEIPWSAIEVILPQEVVRTIVPAMKRAGASDIFEYPLNKVIP